MTGNEKLRKENQSLRNEIAELKEKLQKISEEFSSKKAELTKPDAEKKISSECARSCIPGYVFDFVPTPLASSL